MGATLDRRSVQAWLDAYIDAWRTYDPSKIRALFAEDALYLYSPWDNGNPVRGREGIVENWLENKDVPDSWTAHYEPLAIEGNVAVAQGRTRYVRPDGTVNREFANLFVMQFDDAQRCTHFVEWYMQPRGTNAAHSPSP